MDAAPETAVGQLPKEALDRVRPGAGGRREVEGPAGMVRQPVRDGRVLVGGVVVQNGAELRASSTTSRTFASDVRGLPGGHALSRRRPSTPSRMNRSCQRHTVAFAEPVSAITAIVPKPSSAGRTIRARRACFTLLLPPPAIASSRLRCSSETSKSTPVRIVPPLVCPALSPRCRRAVLEKTIQDSSKANKPLVTRDSCSDFRDGADVEA